MRSKTKGMHALVWRTNSAQSIRGKRIQEILLYLYTLYCLVCRRDWGLKIGAHQRASPQRCGADTECIWDNSFCAKWRIICGNLCLLTEIVFSLGDFSREKIRQWGQRFLQRFSKSQTVATRPYTGGWLSCRPVAVTSYLNK